MHCTAIHLLLLTTTTDTDNNSQNRMVSQAQVHFKLDDTGAGIRKWADFDEDSDVEEVDAQAKYTSG